MDESQDLQKLRDILEADKHLGPLLRNESFGRERSEEGAELVEKTATLKDKLSSLGNSSEEISRSILEDDDSFDRFREATVSKSPKPQHGSKRDLMAQSIETYVRDGRPLNRTERLIVADNGDSFSVHYKNNKNTTGFVVVNSEAEQLIGEQDGRGLGILPSVRNHIHREIDKYHAQP